MDEKSKGYMLVILAGMLWSTTGLFGDVLMEEGITSQQVAFIRLFLGFVFLLSYCLIKDIEALKINKKVFIFSIIIGIVCQAGFNLFYFKTVEIVGVSMAATLLYTSPIFLAILTKVVYKEEINANNKIALLICFIGSILAVTGGNVGSLDINVVGTILGLLSAISYACMPIISKNILLECKAISLLVYGFLISAILMIPISNPFEILPHLKEKSVLVSILGIGLISAAGGYICYFEGISKKTKLSIVGILASGELIFAVLIGWIGLNEKFEVIKLLGILFMIISAIISVYSPRDILSKTKNNKIEYATDIED